MTLRSDDSGGAVRSGGFQAAMQMARRTFEIRRKCTARRSNGFPALRCTGLLSCVGGRRMQATLVQSIRGHGVALPPLRRFAALAAALGVAGLLAWLGRGTAERTAGARGGNAWASSSSSDRTPALPAGATREPAAALRGARRSIEGLAPVESARVQLAARVGRRAGDGVRRVAAPRVPDARAGSAHGIRQLVASSVDGPRPRT